MERFRCKNEKCRQPVLFEGDFIGTVQKKCPKCKEMQVFTNGNILIKEKFCKVKNLI